ncbi:TonB-dependent receptor [Ferrovibrio terrae]|uniref:TonB-dependent receptor n=1 Tax=Ferrovibrio terrae TaxID=2594003 RepID=A0A516GZZ3_9PROT|nr:TonB-dependent receptor [Ferrovibrio terrae]QDO97101.1 TonB-dependent receptor [Ferrovibrio terrae]
MRFGGQQALSQVLGFNKFSLLLTTALVALPLAPAQAADAGSAPVQVAQAQTRIRFAVPAQPLPAALIQFARQANLQITTHGLTTDGKQSAGVTGDLTPNEALARLLEGTGLTWSYTDSRTVNLIEAPRGSGATVLPTLNVEGRAINPNSTMTPMPEYAGGQIARGGQLGMLGNRDVMDTPFSQTNYTNKTIRDQQARTVQDVLLNDPSILTKQNSASDEDGSITIRGFSHTLSSGNGSLNGLAGMAPLRTPDMDYMERVEVLRGPSALLNGMAAFGQGGVGGSYNLVTKKATDEPVTELTARYGSLMQLGTHLDIGRRFGAEKQLGIRANGAYREGDTAVEPGNAEVGSMAINLDYRGERVRISGDVAHQTNDANPQIVQQLVLSGVGGGIVHVPKAPDASTSLNPTWSKQPSKLTLGMVAGEVDITEKVTAYAAIGKQTLDFSLIGPNQPKLLGTDGTYGWNNVEHTNFAYDVLSMQGGLRAKATTGPVNHTFGLNLSQSVMETGEAQATTPFAYTTNIYNPVFGGVTAAADPGAPKKTNETRTSSIGIADTLSILDEQIQFTAGIRQQRVESDSFNTTTGAITSGYDSDALTPALGVVVKPRENVSLYANYVENLQRGTIVSTSFSNAGEVFAPYVSKQYETGVKVDWGRMTTTLAVFQIAQPNTISIAGTPLPRQALDGEVRNRGVELNAYGEVTPGIRLMGGLTLIDSQQTKTQGGLYDGNREAGIPIIRTVVGGEWDTPFVHGLTLTGRFTYTGNQMVSSSNDNLKIPAWELVDLGARYVWDSPWNNKPITFRFNVDNVFDKNYWSASNFRYVQLGAPRTFWLSASVDF